jgi:peptide chain release factor subunit 1
MAWYFARGILVSKRALLPSPIFSECYLFEPPNPVRKSHYKCDKRFHLEDLLDLYTVYDTYAIVLISGKRTDIYTYSKNHTQLIKTLKVDLPNQHKTGGQSAPRFGRIREEKIGLYIRRICEILFGCLVKHGQFHHLGLVLAGPAQLKDQIQNEIMFQTNFQKHLLMTMVIGEINDQSVSQVIQLMEEQIFGINHNSKTIKRFEQMLNDPQTLDLLVFGTTEVLEQFCLGSLAEIFIKEDSLDLLNPTLSAKTKITSISDSSFVKKYGIAVGLRYYMEARIATHFVTPSSTELEAETTCELEADVAEI